MTKSVSLTVQHHTHQTFKHAQASVRHSRTETRLTDNHANANIDKSRTPQNITLIDIDPKQTMDSLYKQQLELYNKKQPQKSRRIPSMWEHLKNNKKSKPLHELVFEYGNALDVRKSEFLTLNEGVDTDSNTWKERVDALVHLGHQLPDLLPDFQFYHLCVHVDESNPHLHASYFPLTANTNNAKEWERLTSNHSTAVTNMASHIKGSPVSGKLSFNVIFHDHLKENMIKSYQDATGTEIRERKREHNPRLTMQEYRDVMQQAQNILQNNMDMMREMLYLTQQMEDKLEEIIQFVPESIHQSFEKDIEELTQASQSLAERASEMNGLFDGDIQNIVADFDLDSLDDELTL